MPDRLAHWALFLDIDGTLVAFCDDPDAVRAPPGLHATLARLHHDLDGAVAPVSGRPINDIDRIFGPPLVAAAGLHGLQRRRGDGSRADAPGDDIMRQALHHRVATLAARLPRMRVENKGPCTALHYREAPELASAVIAGATAIAGELTGYVLQAGDHVVEIKPGDMTKGRAIEAFMREAPFAGRVPVYAGDDLTDEGAFATVNAHGGVSIRVGDREPTQAHFTLPGPAAMRTWLDAVGARLHSGANHPPTP